MMHSPPLQVRLATLVFLSLTPAAISAEEDSFRWLEEIDSPRALEWVKQRNEQTTRRLVSGPEHGRLYADALTVLNAAGRIPQVTQHGAWLYELWKDRDHPRGIFRRTSLEEFRQARPHWETVLDIDALAKAEGKPWAFGGADWLPPENRRCLIQLAPSGGDAVEVREFDVEQREFVPGGFFVPLAKSRVAWRDADSIYVATDFGPDSRTTSGYPRTVKVWSRGAPLADAKGLFTVAGDSVSVSAERLRMHEGDVDVVTERPTFWTEKSFQIIDGRLHPLALPLSARLVGGFHGRLVIWLRDDWLVGGTKYPAGAVVVADSAALRGEPARIELVVAPSAHSIIEAVVPMPAAILVTTLDDVRGRLFRFIPEGSGWKREAVPFPDNGALTIAGSDDDSGVALIRYESFLTPPALYRVVAAGGSPELLKTEAPAFDSGRFEVVQNWTTSADGTRVPYFLVAPKGLKRDGTAPVWMFSYGGFERSLTPAYSGSYEELHGAYGRLWLERGGVFVLPNIRGGGEFGPAWHRAALRENRTKAFEDFEAVARDLAAQKISSPAHIGIEGRSNGGLLVAATMLRHPELYGAVVCGSPLADMKRYHQLLAGASWMAEFGNPDVPADWAFISKYSPYQLVRPGLKLPPMMIYTTTRDDRVHPGHARKLAAKMDSFGYSVEYYEITEGGHHASVTNEQLAERLARTYTFLWSRLR